MRICSVDVGTTGTKVIIFDEEGRILSMAFREYPVICPRDGWAEQDAGKVFDIILELMGSCICNAGIRELDAVSLSVQGDAVIPVDKDGKALCSAILGMDTRSAPQAGWCDQKMGAYHIFSKTGMRPHPINSETKIMWIQQECKEVARQTYKYLTYDSYLARGMGADGYVTDMTMASRSMLCGLLSGDWDRQMLGFCGIDRSVLPDIIPSGSVAGRMLRQTARKLCLRNQPYLVIGGHDQTCAGVGAGAVVPGVAVDSHGTAEVLSAGFPSPVLSEEMCGGFYPCYRHGVKGQYFTFALNHCGGIVFRWYRDYFSEEEKRRASAAGRKAYDVMVEEMEDTPSGLLFLPHLNGSGTPYCDISARGSILGLTLSATRAEVGKALLEGLSYEMRLNAGMFRDMGIRADDIRCVGGGASHGRTVQLKADVLGQPVSTMKNREAASLGAAILALNGLGYFKTVEEGVSCLVKTDRIYYPQKEKANVYSARFELYRQTYHALEPIYRCWNKGMVRDL